MKRYARKTLCLILAAVFVLSLVPAAPGVSAAETPVRYTSDFSNNGANVNWRSNPIHYTSDFTRQGANASWSSDQSQNVVEFTENDTLLVRNYMGTGLKGFIVDENAPMIANGRVSAVIRCDRLSDLGLAFRCKDSGNAVYMGFGQNNVLYSNFINGTNSYGLGSFAYDYANPEDVTMSIRFEGKELVLFIDDRLAYTFTGDQIFTGPGKIGFRSYNSQKNLEVKSLTVTEELFDVTGVKAALEEACLIDPQEYAEPGATEFAEAYAAAQRAYAREASQESLDLAAARLTEAMKNLELKTDENRIVVREDYTQGAGETAWNVDFTAADDALNLRVPASGLAVNSHPELKKVDYAAYTWKLKAPQDGNLGLVFHYVSDTEYNVLELRDGKVWLKNAKSGEEKELGDLPLALTPGKSYTFQLISNLDGIAFYLDGILVCRDESPALVTAPGSVGLYNPAAQAASLALEAVEVYQLYCYFNDFSDPAKLGGWEGTGTTASHVEKGLIDGTGELQLDTAAVSTAAAMETPRIANGSIEFDMLSRGDDVGRLIFMFRARDYKTFEGLMFDIGSNWYTYNFINGAELFSQSFAGKAPLAENEKHHIRMEFMGRTLFLYVDGAFVGSQAYDWPVRPGHFGFRKQWRNSEMHFDNLRMSEAYEIRPADRETDPTVIKSETMSVTMDQNFPCVLSYSMNGKTLPGNPGGRFGLKVNAQTYYPFVTCRKESSSSLLYTLSVPVIGLTADVRYAVKDNELRMEFARLEEAGEKVDTIGFAEDVLFSVNSAMENATCATVLEKGGWTSISDHIHEDLTRMEEGTSNMTYGMLSGDGLAVTVNNTVINNNMRLIRTVTKEENGTTTVGLGSGEFTYRMPTGTHQPLPSAVISLCEDYNEDGEVNWQDAAANYRNIRSHIMGEDVMKNHLMWIAYNAGSQTEEPFLKTADMAKAVYNFTDGFGQMIMEKGYQDEGHDASHGDYGGTIGPRQGGKEDFNKIIAMGKDCNAIYGVHINVNEHMLDARYFDMDTMIQPLAGNWGYYDHAYLVDQARDIISGNRTKLLKMLKEDVPELGFVYVDIYGIDGPQGWMSNDLITTLNDMGFIVGTEFAGPMEQGVAFTHWGNDILYPNTGNDSVIMKYFKHDLDISVSTALTLGNKMLNIGTWQNVSDMNGGIETFYNHTLLTKYLQNHDLLDYEKDYAVFSGGVRTERQGDEVILTQNGREMARWTWWLDGEGKEQTGEATLLLPWFSEKSETKNPDDADKLYHWNPAGGETAWEVPASWTDGTEATVYRLNRDSKVSVGQVTVTDGRITLDAEAKVPYVLYRTGESPRVAGSFGEGSGLRNPGFDAADLKDWNPRAENAVITTAVNAQGDPFLSMEAHGAAGTAKVSQTIENLEPGKSYTLYYFADVSENARLDTTVTVAGKEYRAHTTQALSCFYNFTKWNGTMYQKVKVNFDVPQGVTAAELELSALLRDKNQYIHVDDIRAWKNLNRTPQITDPGYEDYVLYEDFENVEQGYGPFTGVNVFWGHQGHLAEAIPDSQQYLDYVVDGRYSLKINQSSDGVLVRTHANALRLLPDTAYDLGFSYLTGVTGRYAVRIRNDAGDVVYEHMMEDTGLVPGTNSLDSREIRDTFTTDSRGDYYLSVDMLDKDKTVTPSDPMQGSYLERSFFSLDNVFIKFHDSRAAEITALREQVDAAQARKQSQDYPGLDAEVRAAFEELLEEAKLVLDDRNSSAEALLDMAKMLKAALAELGGSTDELKEFKAQVLDALQNWDCTGRHRKQLEAIRDAAIPEVENAQTAEELRAIWTNTQEVLKKAAICPSEAFRDVKADGWYHEAVDYAIENGLMKGVADDRFSIDGTLTRGQLVTILYRAEGSPSIEGMENPFSDIVIAPQNWYAEAVIWAYNNGIVKGVTDVKFAPMSKITREQLVSILYRYDGSPAAEGNLSRFVDTGKVSAYAKQAVVWGVENGIVSGIPAGGQLLLKPQGNATRAQAAAIMMRFLENQAQ